jgi:hypothetical protein
MICSITRKIEAASPPGGPERGQLTACPTTWWERPLSRVCNPFPSTGFRSGYVYHYKDISPVGMLGLVDAKIGITEVVYKAQMMNAFMNIKTA